MLEESHTEQWLALVQKIMKQQQSGSLPKEFPQQDKHKRNENQNWRATDFQNISLNQRLYIEV